MVWCGSCAIQLMEGPTYALHSIGLKRIELWHLYAWLFVALIIARGIWSPGLGISFFFWYGCRSDANSACTATSRQFSPRGAVRVYHIWRYLDLRSYYISYSSWWCSRLMQSYISQSGESLWKTLQLRHFYYIHPSIIAFISYHRSQLCRYRCVMGLPPLFQLTTLLW